MHNVDWKIELRHLALIFFIATIIGLSTDTLAWSLWLSSLLYIAWTLFQLSRIQAWISHKDGSEPPESSGLWGELFDGIYHLQRQSRQEHLRLQAAVDYLQDSLASLLEAAVMIDKNGNIEWANHSAERLLGLEFPNDTGQQLINLVRSPEFISYFEQQHYQQPLDVLSPINNNTHLQIQITFFGKGSRLLFARDITQTHQLQQMRKDFVANVSHELRTPLTVITGYLENFADSPVGDDQRYRRAIDQMLAQSARMENLVKDLTALARLEAMPDVVMPGKESPTLVEETPVEVCPLLQMISDEAMLVALGTRELSIDCDSRLLLLGHAEELRSAFTNLMMNAVKYSQQGDCIEVRWYADEQFAYLSVKDSGVGIEPQHLPRLTERFYRVSKSRTSETGGTGLGLAIVKHVLLRHQGELKIDSEVGVGSTFCCVFPLQRTVLASADT